MIQGQEDYLQRGKNRNNILANRPGISGTVPDFAQLSRRPGNANYCPGNWVNRRDRKLGVFFWQYTHAPSALQIRIDSACTNSGDGVKHRRAHNNYTYCYP